MFYRRKPAVFQVIQYNGENKEEVMDFLPDHEKDLFPWVDDYVVKNSDGNVQFYDKQEFEEEFEKA